MCSGTQGKNSAEPVKPSGSCMFTESHPFCSGCSSPAYVLNASKHESKLLKKRPSGEPLAALEHCADASDHQVQDAPPPFNGDETHFLPVTF